MSHNVLDAFCAMVRIDSESGEEDAFFSYLADLFRSELRAACAFDGFGNLIARVPAKGCSGKLPVLFACHGDTVKPGKGIEPTVTDGVVRSKGDTILGADDKAGISELYTAVQTAERHPELELVITRQEELGLIGAKHLDSSSLNAKMGFVLDSDTFDSIIIGGPSHMTLDIEVTGRAAHAGMEPEKGISAIQAAARAISLLRLGRIDFETTANVGIISGGSIRNGVPDKCTVKAECRSLNHEKCVDYGDVIKEAFEVAARTLGASADVQLDMNYRASSISADSAVVEVARQAIRKLGLTPRAVTITGGTDASVFNAKGIQTVVLGIGAAGEHTNDEHIAVADLETGVCMVHNVFDLLCES
jgi:tripeptide aminopeptidase